jgi:hypothetical protein
MSDHSTPSTFFALKTRSYLNMEYHDRSVNMAFENKHLPLFKVVPPAVGSILHLECFYKIDAISYYDGKIVFHCTKVGD